MDGGYRAPQTDAASRYVKPYSILFILWNSFQICQTTKTFIAQADKIIRDNYFAGNFNHQITASLDKKNWWWRSVQMKKVGEGMLRGGGGGGQKKLPWSWFVWLHATLVFVVCIKFRLGGTKYVLPYHIKPNHAITTPYHPYLTTPFHTRRLTHIYFFAPG